MFANQYSLRHILVHKLCILHLWNILYVLKYVYIQNIMIHMIQRHTYNAVKYMQFMQCMQIHALRHLYVLDCIICMRVYCLYYIGMCMYKHI